jgi:hypothetical protein
MKRLRFLLLLICLGACLCACGDSEENKVNTINGTYNLAKTVVNGYSMTADETESASYIDVSPMGDNLMTTYYQNIGDKATLMSGYISEVYKMDDYTQYKFWISGTSGGVVQTDDWFYLYYYPDGDKIKVEFGLDEGIGEFWFYKK